MASGANEIGMDSESYWGSMVLIISSTVHRKVDENGWEAGSETFTEEVTCLGAIAVCGSSPSRKRMAPAVGTLLW